MPPEDADPVRLDRHSVLSEMFEEWVVYIDFRGISCAESSSDARDRNVFLIEQPTSPEEDWNAYWFGLYFWPPGDTSFLGRGGGEWAPGKSSVDSSSNTVIVDTMWIEAIPSGIIDTLAPWTHGNTAGRIFGFPVGYVEIDSTATAIEVSFTARLIDPAGEELTSKDYSVRMFPWRGKFNMWTPCE